MTAFYLDVFFYQRLIFLHRRNTLELFLVAGVVPYNLCNGDTPFTSMCVMLFVMRAYANKILNAF